MELENKKIIVTFLMHLGDLILTTPFLHALRKAAPHSHITYLVDDKLKEIVEHNPNIDEVWTIDKKGKDDNLKALLATAGRISTYRSGTQLLTCRSGFTLYLLHSSLLAP